MNEAIGTITYRKSRRATSKDDFETWIKTDVANTLNTFDGGGGTRATTIVVDEKNTDRKKIL